MSVTIPLIKQACKNLGLKFQEIDNDGIFLKVFFETQSKNKSHLFIANNLGLNSEVVEKICRDKSYTYQLLSKHVQMPKTLTYIDPDAPFLYKNFLNFESQEIVIKNILDNQSFPLILKSNSKSMGINVFKCKKKSDVKKAISIIWNHNSSNYDHVLLVQQFIKIKKEFRVIVFDSKIELVYLKDNKSKNAGKTPEFLGNLSPLHFENSRAVLLSNSSSKNQIIIQKIESFIEPIFSQINLRYAGLDIAMDDNNELFLIEMNSKPGFSYFVKDNGSDRVIKLMEKVIVSLSRK